MVPGFGVSAECQSIGTSERSRGLVILPQKLSVRAYFELSFPGCGLCKKLDFIFLSLGGPRHGALVWCLGRMPKHRNH